ncbi:MAG: hypothetical protein ABI718_06905 [Acidobacteriota bacterium]
MLSTELVESKWGFGHLYTHGIHDVPLNCGTRYTLHAPITRQRSLELLRGVE